MAPFNFDHAEYSAPAAPHCALCTRGLDQIAFRVDGHLACAACVGQLRERFPSDTRANGLRATAIGLVAALLSGLLLFLLFRATRGSWIGFASIGLGYIVGRAVRIGSQGRGGRRYQVIAAILCYFAVVVAVSAALVGPEPRLLLWILLPLAPLLLPIVGQVHLAFLLLLFAGIAIRWAWVLNRPFPTPRITGPDPLPAPVTQP